MYLVILNLPFIRFIIFLGNCIQNIAVKRWIGAIIANVYDWLISIYPVDITNKSNHIGQIAIFQFSIKSVLYDSKVEQ